MSENIEIEYIGADFSGVDPTLFAQFQGIFSKFARPEELLQRNEEIEQSTVVQKASDTSITAEEDTKLSKKKKKLMSRLSVTQLKQLVPRPDVVEAHDVTSHDPRLLVFLKAYRGTVPVPRHWCSKRQYLAGKRGIERPPFQLPEFIAETGIAKIRESVLEAESLKKSSQKAREKMQPKMGRIDIDYQVLHDAFFKYQTKPKMTTHGDLYYEGKEFELDLKERKPGIFSAELIEALGMQVGFPPPWLINMQMYGPPPSYPHLKIPGLNAPLPPGCEYGYQPGGWGQPPVDEYGRPIYGDVFGVLSKDQDEREVVVDKNFRFGEMVSMPEEVYDEEEDEEEEESAPAKSGSGSRHDSSGMETPNTLAGIASTASIATGLETPDGAFDLRKRGMETPVVETMHKELYHVIQEKSNHVGSSALFGSDRTYVLPGAGITARDVQLSVNPDEIQDADKLKELYQHEVSQKQNGGVEDGAIGEEDNDPRNKRKRRAEATVNSKRHRDFKF